MPNAAPLADSLDVIPLPATIAAAGAEVLPLRPLAVDARTAAALIGISERSLFDLTEPRGPIACVRLPNRRLFSVAELERWLKQETERGRSKTDQE